jgi:CRISPR system Cascade subunit CasD
MLTLLLRLAGPMQSWGTDSKFEVRRTGSVPSKSGVIGLLAAALGRNRDDSLEDLAKLRFGVRADLEGRITYDYQIVKTADKPYVTKRYYISDGIYLAGFESADLDFLTRLDDAVRNPHYFLFLGRKSYVPTIPIALGVREKGLKEALTEEEWLLPAWRRAGMSGKIRLVLEAEGAEASSFVNDVPVSFDPHQRSFSERAVYETVIDMMPFAHTQHDAFAALEEENVSDKS